VVIQAFVICSLFIADYSFLFIVPLFSEALWATLMLNAVFIGISGFDLILAVLMTKFVNFSLFEKHSADNQNQRLKYQYIFRTLKNTLIEFYTGKKVEKAGTTVTAAKNIVVKPAPQ